MSEQWDNEFSVSKHTYWVHAVQAHETDRRWFNPAWESTLLSYEAVSEEAAAVAAYRHGAGGADGAGEFLYSDGVLVWTRNPVTEPWEASYYSIEQLRELDGRLS